MIKDTKNLPPPSRKFVGWKSRRSTTVAVGVGGNDWRSLRNVSAKELCESVALEGVNSGGRKTQMECGLLGDGGSVRQVGA